MSWNLDSSRPIYAQIIEKVSLDIVSGKYQPGDKLPSERAFCIVLGFTAASTARSLTDGSLSPGW